MDELGIILKRDEYNLNVKPLLKIVLSRFFGNSTGFTDMCVQFIPSPKQNAPKKVKIKNFQIFYFYFIRLNIFIQVQ